MASCIQIRSLQQAFLDGELSSVEKLQFEDHLRECPACTGEMENARFLTVRLFEVLGQDRLQDDLTPPIMAHLPEMDAPYFSGVHRIKGFRPKKVSRMSRAASLIPVFVPVLLVILAALLWAAWPTSFMKEAKAVGVITLSRGEVQSGHTAGLAFQETQTKDILAKDVLVKTGENGLLLFGLLGPTQATLYGNSLLQVVNERELLLEQGRIFLDVHGEPRAFLVGTPHGDIRVMGTSFQVDTGPQGTSVTVVRGQVLVENDKSFALLTGGSQGVFQKGGVPEVYQNVPAKRCLEEARSVLPDPGAERYFRSQYAAASILPATVQKQIFMVETRRRPVSAVKLNWLPDPYAEGHAGYQVYVSDSALNPLFKAYIAPDVFKDKSRDNLLVAVPENLQGEAVSMLHITLMPDFKSGPLETSFTEVSAIGIRQ